jgi:hypothetical protein
LSGLLQDQAAATLVRALTDKHLLVTNWGEDQQPLVEVAHEALLRSWPRLVEWVETTRNDQQLLAQMRLAAQQWNDRGRQRAYLWTHARATEMIKMLANLKPQPPLNVIEQAFARPEAEHLLDELNERDTTHDRRAQIGDRLAELGDPRPGVGLRPDDGLPELVWCHVQLDTEAAAPQGSLRSHTYACENMAEVAIEGTGNVRVGAFYIARYPVTYVQYRAFLEAHDGFRNAKWWEGLAVSERQRATPSSQTRKILNHPAENVSWYDATAFCRWLSARLRYEVRLPNEAEWQLAANGNNHGYAYPWGADWRSECANTSSSHLSRMIAVGMYPCGVAPCGALDMSGNVCEWTASFDPEDDKRVLCGGAWYLPPSDALATARTFSFAYERLSHFGFRVACIAPH